jgi:hypothetical protein
MIINYYELSINVIISVLFIYLFIDIFLFRYGPHIGRVIVENQIKFLSEDIGGYINLLGNNINKKVKQKLLDLPEVNLDEEDNRIKEINSQVIKKAKSVNSLFIVFTIAIVYYLNKTAQLNISDVLIKNLIILFFIGLTIYIFLTYFAADYISINPNLVKYTIVEKLKKL